MRFKYVTGREVHEGPIISNASNQVIAELAAMAAEKQPEVRKYLSQPWKLRWLKKKDPELVKALSRIASHLTDMERFLESAPHPAEYAHEPPHASKPNQDHEVDRTGCCLGFRRRSEDCTVGDNARRAPHLSLGGAEAVGFRRAPRRGSVLRPCGTFRVNPGAQE